MTLERDSFLDSPGFETRVYMCQHPSCNTRCEAIPQSRDRVMGMPEGWVEVTVDRFKRTIGGGITSAFDTVKTMHFCSVAHLPTELLPEDT